MPGQKPKGRASAAGMVRLLFGCSGWPSGIIELASWAKRRRLANVVVYQLQPGRIFRLDPEDGHFLAPGPVDPKLIDSFARRRRPLSDDAHVVRTDRSTVEIHDDRRRCTYRIVAAGGNLDVYVPEHFEAEQFLAAIRRFAEGRGLTDRFFEPDGTLKQPARRALTAAGGRFVGKLIEFDPHVVGFRIEGGDFQDVKKYIRAVRLFSKAEIVLGGPTPTSHPKEVLEESGADYVFAGEAEEPLNRFLTLAWQPNSKDLQADIPGLAFHHADRIYHNTLPADGYERTVLDVRHKGGDKVLKSLRNRIRPVASSDVIAANRLDWSVLEGFDREFDSLFFTAGRGCPGACTFCAKLHGRQVRTKSAEQLLEEIEAADAKVTDGTIKVTRWKLFEYTNDPVLAEAEVAWAAVYDEDFFLNRRRAVEFFRLWDKSPLKHRYRLGFQTNPCSLLTSRGEVHGELLRWIDRLEPMIQVGAESFNPELLMRWRKRHTIGQLTTVLDALDRTRQDYAVFLLLTDFDTTPEELVETLRLLILSALPRRRMRIAGSPFTIPLFDSETRKLLEYRRFLTPEKITHFSDYERTQPGWMNPLAAELADLADSELRWALNLQQRESALVQAFEVVLDRIRQEGRKAHHLRDQAQRAMDQIKDARFQGIGPF